MLHLFQDGEYQTYAANDLDHAKALWKADTGSDPEADTAWTSLDDSAMVTVESDGGERVTKTAAEWANEHSQPGYRFGGQE